MSLLKDDRAVSCLNSNKEKLGNLSLNQEAVIVSAAFFSNEQNIIIVKPSVYAANQLYNRIHPFLQDKCRLFIAEESLQIEAIASSPETEVSRLESLAHFISSKEKCVCITNLGAFIRYLPDKKLFIDSCLNLRSGDKCDPLELREDLRRLGYKLCDRVSQPLNFAYRGEVLDFFSVQYDNPVRIEFFDDEIDSIRFFDPATQLTISPINEVTILPAGDILFSAEDKKEIEKNVQKKLKEDMAKLSSEEAALLQESVNNDLAYIGKDIKENYLYRYYSFTKNHYTLKDYLDNPRVIISTKEENNSHYKTLIEETYLYLNDLYNEGKALSQYSVFADNPYDKAYNIHILNDFKDPVFSLIRDTDYPALSLNSLIYNLNIEKKSKRILVFLEGTSLKNFLDALIVNNTPYELLNDNLKEEKGIYVIPRYLEQGFTYEDLIVLTEKEIFNLKQRRTKFSDKFRTAEILNDYDDLSIGDYVVHNDYGIGRYLGIVTEKVNGITHDYLNIAYQGNDRLLVPLEQFRLVRKFIGSEGNIPRLNKIGSREWQRTKEKLKEDVKEVAANLLDLYLKREENIGFAFSKDSELQEEFEEGFDHELTDDQKTALKEIKEDMESSKPMDRLVCGDVGFGKTELALRASFKAVLDKKQVAVLCPTTILSRQHYLTFKKRLEEYAVSVAVFNRFNTAEEDKEIIKKVKEGKIDVVVGTHKILSSRLKFKDLGLLVVDEEQRFGVNAKEKIKMLKKGIDVLSLSATPIPRTLEMSLIGVRSLSQLNTPPLNRMPVQTYLVEKDYNLVKTVSERELGRNGQIFYIYNNIRDIFSVASRLQSLLPEARIAVIHGRMDREIIEDTMLRFTDYQYDILFCTSIIENGIDIPNANTIIIDNADKFGLAQLYQIKGRVGRSDKLAYAYLMYAPEKQLSETASKRLSTIKDFTQLGSGYKIALRDLSIRGAGDLLGERQAGFINTVGMDLYVRMLREAIMEKQGITLAEEEKIIPSSQIGVDAYIPREYTRADYEKINLYDRINHCRKQSDLESLKEEVKDRFGRIPKEVSLLFEKREMEILAGNDKVKKIQDKGNDIEIYFEKAWCDKIDGVKLFETVSNISRDINMRYVSGSIILKIPKKGEWLILTNKVLEKINNL